MPIRINIKRHKPSFEGGQPRWNVVASGPDHAWNKQIERFLYLHGVEPLAMDQGSRVWSTKPHIGAPALYLAPLMALKYGTTCNPEIQDMVNNCKDPQKMGDGLDAFMASRKGLDRGASALQVQAGSNDFIANCNVENEARQSFLEGAGWIPLKMPENQNRADKIKASFGSMPYRTSDPFMASNLEPFMSPKTLQRLKQKLAVSMKRIAQSRSQEAPDDFDVPCPEGLSYMNFQKGGISMISSTGKSGIIADDMGLGKTIQGIGLMNNKPEMSRAIVFCQANMKLKWVREIEKWLINQDLTVGYAQGDEFPDTDIVVINYDIADRHIENFNNVKWDVVLPDEAHNLKNHEAKRTMAILGIEDAENTAGMIPMSKDGIMVHLTGTPRPNRTSEIWNLISSTRPDIWGRGSADRQLFINRYEPPTLIKKQMIGKGGKTYEKILALPGKPVREMELQLRLRGSGSFVRRMKRDTDLPPKFRTPIPLPFKLTDEDRKALAQADADMDEIQNGLRQSGVISAGRSRLATPVIDVVAGIKPGSPHFSEIARVRRNLGVLKAPYAARFIIDELMEDQNLPESLQRKTVVFAHHKDVIKIIAQAAEKEMPGQVLIYDGSVATKKRQEQVDLFMENPEKRLFIMSLAGATGITLTAAARLRAAEMDWSSSNMVQIEDRIWRIGQELSVDIGYLFVPDSLDVNIGSSLISKMESEEKSMNSLSFSDLREKMIKAGGEGYSKPKPQTSKAKNAKASKQDDTQMSMSF